MPKLYLIRHGEPVHRNVILGRSDPPLSEQGREQCRFLRFPSVRVMYCSPLRRTRESAEIVAGVHGEASIVVLDDLVEIGMGEWDGKSWAEIEAEFPDQARAKLQDWRGVTPPGGESWAAFEERVNRAVNEVTAGPIPAAIVGHLAVNACIAARLRGDDPIGFVQDYLEIIQLEL